MVNRLPNGTFAIGNAGGPGNPHAAQVALLRAAMLSAVTADDIASITRKLVAMAESGDLKAMELLLSRTIGKPAAGPSLAVQINTDADAGRTLAAEVVSRIQASRSSEQRITGTPGDR